MKIVVDSAIPFFEGLFEPFCEVCYIAGGEISAEDVRDAEALVVRTRTKCDAALLEGSSVRIIATATIGFDHIDMEYCKSRSIEVVTSKGCNARAVLQWFGAAMAHLSQEQGWQPSERTLGVVGVGSVGSLIEKYARDWGFTVLCCDPPRQKKEGGDFHPLNYLLERCDILTFHTPLDDSTHHLCGAEQLSGLGENTIIVNSSRGEVVDNGALYESGLTCVMDVWEGEPNLHKGLLESAAVATPHIAGYSRQGKAIASCMAASALSRALNLDVVWRFDEVNILEPKAISWDELCSSIHHYCDIKAQSMKLKHAPEQFEAMRDRYNYREEYF